MKRDNKAGPGQHALQRRFIEIRARNMQLVLIALAEKARELIPRPTTYLDHGAKDFRRSGLDAAAVRRYQEAKFDLTVPERDTKVPAENVPALQNL